MKRYFIWKDADCNGINPEWKEVSGTEFLKLSRENKGLRFIHSFNEDDIFDDEFIFQATEENYLEWHRERMKYTRQNYYLHRDYEVVSIDDLVEPDDSEGLTWADVIPDTTEEDEELERQEEVRRSALVSKMLAEIAKLPEDDKKLIFAMFLSPEKTMSEKEYAESIGISQQNVNKRKLKIFKKIRAAMGVKK